jgi:hypothetical protein
VALLPEVLPGDVGSGLRMGAQVFRLHLVVSRQILRG